MAAIRDQKKAEHDEMLDWCGNFDSEAFDLKRIFFFFSSRRRHTRFDCDWSSDVCSSDLDHGINVGRPSFFPDLAHFNSTMQPTTSLCGLLTRVRSEERRVGKECRSRW